MYITYIHTNHKGCDELNLIISNSSGVPIYEQIYDQIKASIISGELKENDLLPSIQALAKDMRISVITTKRAYEELERNGFIQKAARDLLSRNEAMILYGKNTCVK